MAGRLVRRVVPALAPRLSGERGQRRQGLAAVLALEDPRHLDAGEQPTVLHGQVRDLRHLLLAVGLVGQALARVLPRLAQVGAAPDRRAVPLARRRRVDRPARRVVDGVVDRPPLAERPAQLPVAPGLVAFEQEAPLAGSDQNNRPCHCLTSGSRALYGLSDSAPSLKLIGRYGKTIEPAENRH